MKFYILKDDCDFWPCVPWRKHRAEGYRTVPAGTIVISMKPAKGAPLGGPTQTAVEVLGGPHKGHQRYATTNADLIECSPLELLARQAKD